jgi:hypothetical protein
MMNNGMQRKHDPFTPPAAVADQQPLLQPSSGRGVVNWPFQRLAPPHEFVSEAAEARGAVTTLILPPAASQFNLRRDAVSERGAVTPTPAPRFPLFGDC